MNYKDALFVIIQFAFFIAYYIDFELNSPLFIPWKFGIYFSVVGAIIIIISLIQLNKNLSPFPSPVENGSLVTSGIYSIVRHPIYLGIIISFFNFSLYSGSLIGLIITLLLTILFHFKATYEEEKLIEKYPQYREYRSNTCKILPFIRC